MNGVALVKLQDLFRFFAAISKLYYGYYPISLLNANLLASFRAFILLTIPDPVLQNRVERVSYLSE